MVDRKYGCYALGYCCLIACCASGCRGDASPRGVHTSGAIAPQPQLRPVSFEDSDASSLQVHRQAVMIVAEPITLQAPPSGLIEPAEATTAPQNSLPEPQRDTAEPQRSDEELAALIDQAIAIHPEIRRLRHRWRKLGARAAGEGIAGPDGSGDSLWRTDDDVRWRDPWHLHDQPNHSLPQTARRPRAAGIL